MVKQMSDKELLRTQLMAQLVDGKLSQKDAAQRLEVTVRQVKRLKLSYARATERVHQHYDGATELRWQGRARWPSIPSPAPQQGNISI